MILLKHKIIFEETMARGDYTCNLRSYEEITS